MYVQGFVIPVKEGDKPAYCKVAQQAGDIFRDYGCIEIVESWEADVKDGNLTDFRKAVNAQAGEMIVFSWAIWPDRETCDKAAAQMEADERMALFEEMPFDGNRMIYGGFAPIFTMGRN